MTEFSQKVTKSGLDDDTVSIQAADGDTLEVSRYKARSLVLAFAEQVDEELSEEMMENKEKVTDLANLVGNNGYLNEDERRELERKNYLRAGRYEAFQDSSTILFKAIDAFFEGGGDFLNEG